MKRLLAEVILLTTLFPVILTAQTVRQYSVAFYNAENLCDTLRSDFYDDSEYTPGGRYRWNTERYQAKLRNIARVIDDMDADAVGLAEVENENVLKDLIATLRTDYCYIHRTTSDSRGMDVALLYKADRIFPERVEQIYAGSSREILHLFCTFGDEPMDIMVWHAPSKLNSTAYRRKALEGLRRAADSLVQRGAHLIIAGDMNADPDEKIFNTVFGDGEYVMPVAEATRTAGGSYADKGRWLLFDNILISKGCTTLFEKIEGGVFVRKYMLFDGKIASDGTPKRTFQRRRYTGGFSDHLPVYIICRE